MAGEYRPGTKEDRKIKRSGFGQDVDTFTEALSKAISRWRPAARSGTPSLIRLIPLVDQFRALPLHPRPSAQVTLRINGPLQCFLSHPDKYEQGWHEHRRSLVPLFVFKEEENA
jgi:hypothetical protein